MNICLGEDFKPVEHHEIEGETMELVHDTATEQSYRCLLCGAPEIVIKVGFKPLPESFTTRPGAPNRGGAY